MNYYLWANGYANTGIVKADTIDIATEKVINEVGECRNITLLDNWFDENGVAILILIKS